MEMHTFVVLLLLFSFNGIEFGSLENRTVFVKARHVLSKAESMGKKFKSEDIPQRHPGYSKRYQFGSHKIFSNALKSLDNALMEEGDRMVMPQSTKFLSSDPRFLLRTQAFKSGNRTSKNYRVDGNEAMKSELLVREKRSHNIVKKDFSTETNTRTKSLFGKMRSNDFLKHTRVRSSGFRSHNKVRWNGFRKHTKVKSNGFRKLTKVRSSGVRKHANKGSNGFRIQTSEKSNGFRKHTSEGSNGLSRIGHAQSHHYFARKFHNNEERHRQRFPTSAQANNFEKDSPILTRSTTTKRGRRGFVIIALMVSIGFFMLLLAGILTWVCYKHDAMASRVFGKWQKRNRSDDYTLLPDGEDNVSIETEEATEDAKIQENLNENIQMPKPVEESASLPERKEEIMNNTPLTGADEQQEGTGNPSGIRQTLLPIYMGRYNAFQGSSESSRSPSELHSDTESDVSDVSKGKCTFPTQIVKNVLQNISSKLSIKNIHESQDKQSPNTDVVVINHTATESLVKNSVSQPSLVQVPVKVEAARLNSRYQTENSSVNTSTSELHEAVDNVERGKAEDLQEGNRSFSPKENPGDSDDRRHSVEADLGCPASPKTRYWRKKQDQIRSFNGEVLIPNHNLSDENSESVSKSNELMSAEFNLIETKPIVHMVASSKESDNEFNYVKEEVSNKGAANNDAEWAKNLSSTTKVDRIAPIDQKQTESKNICEAVKPELENDCNTLAGSCVGETFDSKDNSVGQNLLPGLTDGHARSIGLSSFKKLDDPELSNSIWTANDFVTGNSRPDLKHIAKDCSTEDRDGQCDLKISQLESEEHYFIVQDTVENSKHSTYFQDRHTNLRKDSPMSFDSLDDDYHEGTARIKIPPSSHSYIYYEPEEIVLAREITAMADLDTFPRRARKDDSAFWQPTHRDSRLLKRTLLDSGSNSSSRSTNSSMANMESKNLANPNKKLFLEGRRLLSDKSIQTMKKGRSRWKVMNRIFRSKKSPYTEEGSVKKKIKQKRDKRRKEETYTLHLGSVDK